MMPLASQLIWLFVLSLPVACISWMVTHEEVFMEWIDFCKRQCLEGRLLKKKFFFLFTCEYCFSHYVTILFLILIDYRLLLPDWRGYLIAGFAIVWLANLYMSLYGWMRISMKKERTEVKVQERQLED